MFAGFDAVVAPSGSCAAHVRTHVPEHADDPDGVAARTFELSEFLVDRLGVDGRRLALRGLRHLPPDLPLAPDAPASATGPSRSSARCTGVELRPLGEATECCGFGGMFAVRNADVSTAMLADKLRRVEETGAGVVCACDASCLLHIGGGLERRSSTVRAVHLAEVLAS